jgi:hypothetical protein
MSSDYQAPIVAVSHMWLGNYRAWGALTIYHAIVFAGILTVAVRGSVGATLSWNGVECTEIY